MVSGRHAVTQQIQHVAFIPQIKDLFGFNGVAEFLCYTLVLGLAVFNQGRKYPLYEFIRNNLCRRLQALLFQVLGQGVVEKLVFIVEGLGLLRCPF